jgi:general secretion pathway protein F
MAVFQVKVTNARGGTRSFDLSATTKEDAERIARQQGRVISIKKKMVFDIVPGMTRSERYTFMRRMATMLRSKVGTSETLNLMATQFGGNIRKCAKKMLDRVSIGMTIPEAMDMDRKNFPVMVTALVKAGFATGLTWQALQDAADFEHKMANSNKGAIKQVWSAIGTFLTAGFMMLGTTEYFGPQVMDNPMFQNNPAVDVEWARTLGDVCSTGMIVLMGIFFFFFLIGTVGRRTFPNLMDKFIMKVPYYRDLILSKTNHVAYYRLSLLISSGVRLEEAINLSEQSTPRGALKTDLKAALAALRKGQKWASVMKTLDQMDKAALTLAVNREDVALTLNALAEQSSDLYVSRINSFAPGLASVAAICVLLSGVVMFAQTILPMLQLAAGT